MIGTTFQCVHHLDAFAGISQSHGNISQPLLMAYAIDGAASKPAFELCFIPREQLRERHVIQPVPHRKIRLDRSLRKAIPRAY